MPASTKMAEYPALRLPESNAANPCAIYVHWPFCERKCPYCDFNSHVREQVDQKAWRQAMIREIDTFAAQFPNLTAKSIFFGGGTPSLMPPETTHAVIERIKTHWQPDGKIEVTLEANPSSVEAGRFKNYADAGVNRVSLGIQSLKDSSLKFLGRLHSASEAMAALEIAQDNFSRVSFDMIYALPQQSLEEWRAELIAALAFSPSHLSLYQLTIEEGTAFYHQYQRGKFMLPDEDTAAALYRLTQDITEGAGLPSYETSNHARLGEESQHNLAYWLGEPYIGIGPGAHGRMPGNMHGSAYAHMQIKRPEDWLSAVNTHGHATISLEAIDPDERAIETIMMNLRLRAGINKTAFMNRLGKSLSDYVSAPAVADLAASGHIIDTAETLRVTSKGQPVLNFLLTKLII